jgi:acetyl-CoA carboxylase biotin carboxyl carrier protein
MDFNEIKKLVKLVENANIASLEIEDGDMQIRIDKAYPEAATPMSVYSAAVSPQPVAPPAAPAIEVSPAASAAIPAESDNAGTIAIKAPMVGTFYRSPSPEADSFVEVGTRVKIGQTLCILEAMKIMNEIEAELDGTITEVLVENGQPVQFDQVIFRIEP